MHGAESIVDGGPTIANSTGIATWTLSGTTLAGSYAFEVTCGQARATTLVQFP